MDGWSGTQDTIRINNALNVVGIVVGAADVFVAYRDGEWDEFVIANGLLALDIGSAVFDYRQTSTCCTTCLTPKPKN